VVLTNNPSEMTPDTTTTTTTTTSVVVVGNSSDTETPTTTFPIFNHTTFLVEGGVTFVDYGISQFDNNVKEETTTTTTTITPPVVVLDPTLMLCRGTTYLFVIEMHRVIHLLLKRPTKMMEWTRFMICFDKAISRSTVNSDSSNSSSSSSSSSDSNSNSGVEQDRFDWTISKISPQLKVEEEKEEGGINNTISTTTSSMTRTAQQQQQQQQQ
jgi:hypothetical protein